MVPTYAPICRISLNIQLKRPGHKPKCLMERAIPVIKSLQRIERSYSGEKKIQVLYFFYHYSVPFMTEDDEETTWEVYHEEASAVFPISCSTITSCWKNRNRITQTPVGQCHIRSVLLCQWSPVEEKLFLAFCIERGEAKTVRQEWFRTMSR